MPFKLPSMDETRDLVVALGKALFSSANFGSRRTYHGRRSTYLAGAVTALHAHVDSVQRDVHPLTAGDGKPINDWGNTVGVARKDATPARKAAAGRVTGAPTSTVSIGEQLRHETSGLIYQINSAVTIPGLISDPDTFVDADIVAVDTGAKTRLEAGEVLNFLAAPSGIQTSVVLQLALDEDGFDSEQFGSYRQRVLSTFGETPSGGNQSDFVKWALASLNTIAKAYAYPNRVGSGSMDVVGFYNGTGAGRALTVDDRDSVKQYIQTVAPFQIAGEGAAFRVLLTVPDPQNVEILIEPDGKAAFAFDWDDTDGPTVLTWNGTTRELRFSAALPASIRAGHRLIIVDAGNLQDGREFKIESISGSDKVILEKVPAVAPAAPNKIYSGGPLVAPIRDAIVAHLNGETVYAGRGLTPLPASSIQSTVGLDILAEGIGPANPAGAFGTWSGGILRAALFGIAKYKAGVRNVTIVTPAADYEAVNDEFPLDDQIHYVTPNAIVIRRA